MNERQLEFIWALLQLALEMEGVSGMAEWLGDDQFDNWTKDDTIEVKNLIEGVKA